MDNRIYDYWAATLQDGYIGKLVDIAANAGGAKSLYELPEQQLKKVPGITDRLAGYIIDRRGELDLIEEEYCKMDICGICYVNHTDDDFPKKLRNIPSMPYGLFVRGELPDPAKPAVAIVGARECSEYGRLMAQFLGSRLAGEGVQVISGMAWGIDGIAQEAALDAGGTSFAVLGCGVDISYPAKNRCLYNRLCDGGNGVISEYAPGTSANSRLFPPRNRIISGLCDVLIVVEARQRSGTLITVDMAIDQGKIVMVVPGRLTDSLSLGCLNLLSQGALPVTGVESVLEQLHIGRQLELPGIRPEKAQNKRVRELHKPIESMIIEEPAVPEGLQAVANVLTLEPLNTETISDLAGLPLGQVMIMLTKLELEGLAREVWPGYFIRNVPVS